MSSSRLRWLLQYLAVQTLARWVGVCIIFLLLVPPLTSTHLLESTRGDSRLMVAGAETLTTLLLEGVPRLLEQWPLITVVLTAVWALRLVVSAVSWQMVWSRKCVTRRETWAESLELYVPFVTVSFGILVVVAILFAVFFLALPLLGAILYPVLGEAPTDLVHLGILALLCLGSLGLILWGELARASLVIQRGRLSAAVDTATARLRHRASRLVASAGAYVVLALLVNVTAWLLHLQAQQNTSETWLWASVAAVELAALLSNLLRLRWLERVLAYTSEPLEEPTLSKRALS